jgi:type I restriction enzyme S subunit
VELGPGFKPSEAGPIPEDWEAASLGEHLEFKNGISKAGHYFGHGSPIVNYMDVFSQPHLCLERLRGKVTVTRDEAKRFSVRRGDEFFTRTSETAEEIGMSAVAMTERPDVVFSGFVLRGRPITGDFESSYLGYALRTKQARKQIESRATYTTRALTNGGILSLINIARPPLPEQRAIAEVLQDIDAWVAAAEAEAAKLVDVKAAAMEALLTPTTRLPGFEGRWVRRRINDLYDFGRTVPVSRAAYGDDKGVACVHYGDIHVLWDGHLDLSKSRVPTVARQALSAGTRLANGDVLVADAAEDTIGVGKAVEVVGLIDQEVVGGLHVQALRRRADNVAIGFAGYLFQQGDYRRSVERAASGLKVYGIAKSQLAQIEMLLPPTIAEQRAIADALADIDAALATAKAVVAKSRGVKSAAMDALLSGHIRLPLE